jgi:epsilon-lactone hydrolase
MKQNSYPPLQVGPRSIPVPVHASPEAQAYIGMPHPTLMSGISYPPIADKQAWREHIAVMNSRLQMIEDAVLSTCPVSVTWTELGGARVAEVVPQTISQKHLDRALMNIHGGAYVYGAGSLMEAAVVAHLGQIKVYAVDYRVPPDHCFPANLEDTTAVYRALLQSYPASRLAIYGTSAGGTYAATTILKLRQLGLPLPAAAGMLTPGADLSSFENGGDSCFTNEGLDSLVSGSRQDPTTGPLLLFIDGHDPKDPLISPLYGDYARGFCPTYFLTGTRDYLLSATALMHRAVHRAGHKTELHVFEGMSHAFHLMIQLPEAHEATLDMVRFFDTCMDEASAT